MNRQSMPNADHDLWTLPETFAEAVFCWAETATGGGGAANKVSINVPALENGQLYSFTTEKDSKTGSIVDKINDFPAKTR